MNSDSEIRTSVAADVRRLKLREPEGFKKHVARGKRSATPGNPEKRKGTPEGCKHTPIATERSLRPTPGSPNWHDVPPGVASLNPGLPAPRTLRVQNSTTLLLLFILLLSILSTNAITLSHRWFYLPINLQVDQNLARVEALLDRAKAAGYNGVFYADAKTSFWWTMKYQQRWKQNVAKFQTLVRERDMTLVAGVYPFGWAGNILWHNVNLAAGMPVRDAPMIAKNGQLFSADTTAIPNGNLEQWDRRGPIGARFIDRHNNQFSTDSETKHGGKFSIRFDCDKSEQPHGLSRLVYSVNVKPFQQYRFRAWMKTKDLTASQVSIQVRAGHYLQYQDLRSYGRNPVRLPPLYSANNLTGDWLEQIVSFNSMQYTNVYIYAGIWGGKKGSIWWDDIRIENTPTLNLLRRDTLPLTIKSEDGLTYEEGRDYERVENPATGHTLSYPGVYDTRHDPPVIKLTKNSRIKEGQTVLLSCYHASITNDGKMAATLDHPELWRICETEIVKLLEVLDPDVVFMKHDELRVGGWEPQEQKFKTSGELLAHHIKRCVEIIRKHTDKPICVWSDMFDPHHNATDDYFLVKSDLAGSWEGLDPGVTIIKWGGGQRGAKGLQHFADRGHHQIIAGYYDRNPKRDHANWQKAAKGVPNIKGVMYTTWQYDYSDLEEFAQVWWGGKK